MRRILWASWILLATLGFQAHVQAAETNPVFSPDGTQIAFTGEYDGNVKCALPGSERRRPPK